jgi:hypothetical protein
MAPAATPSVTVAPGQHFTGRIVALGQQPGLQGAIEGQVTNRDHIPVPALPIVVRCDGCTPPVELKTATNASWAFAITFAQPGIYSISAAPAIAQRAALEAIALQLNLETLAFWRELLNCFGPSSTLRVGDVNERAAGLSHRVRQSDLAALDALAQAGFLRP